MDLGGGTSDPNTGKSEASLISKISTNKASFSDCSVTYVIPHKNLTFSPLLDILLVIFCI